MDGLAPPEEFQPLSEQGLERPAAMFVHARDERPAFFAEALGGWVISRREDIEWALEDFATFSNTGLAQVPVPPEFVDAMPPELFASSFLAMDPPRHTLPRKIGQRGFTRPRMEQLAPSIELAAHALIDDFADHGQCDLMHDYALALAARTIMGLIGLDEADAQFLQQLRSDHLAVLTSFAQPIAEPGRTAVWTRYSAAHEFLRRLVDERRCAPRDDIVSVMAGATGPDGGPALSRERIALHLCELAMAGIDTTANLIANAVMQLSSRPDQLAELRASPELWEAAVEETLRIHPSTSWVPRLAMRDVEIGAAAIPNGSLTWLALVSVSNDPAVHVQPELFDIHRSTRADHLAFGKGRHFCLGAPLARIETRIGLRVLHERLPDVRPIDGRRPEFNNLAALPLRVGLQVEWTPAGARTR